LRFLPLGCEIFARRDSNPPGESLKQSASRVVAS
jgi:hypothetical protein